MARLETPQVHNSGQDTAEQTVPDQQTTAPPALTDKRSRNLFPSALNKDILSNPVLYIGRADF